MKIFLKLTMFFLIFSGVALAREDIRISAKNNTKAELQTKEQLQRLLKQYDVSAWTFTNEVVIDENVIPHSHPVLTLSARYLKDDELLLSTFVHEQIHWSLDKKDVNPAVDDLKILFPKVPVGGSEGAQDEYSTYVHLIICHLEYRAARQTFGELKALQIINFLATDHYKWNYRTILERRNDVGKIIAKHKLNP